MEKSEKFNEQEIGNNREKMRGFPKITIEDLMSSEEYQNWENDELKKKGEITYEPYTVSGQGKEVRYFGARHSNKPEDPMPDGIKSEFEKAKPDIVFVEGNRGLQFRREEELKYLKNASWEEVIKETGESGFAAKLAAENGIEVICSEPELSDEIKYLIDRGFSKKEIFAFYFYRQLDYYQRNLSGGEKGEAARELFRKYIQLHLDGFEKSTNWESFDYSTEHAEEIGKEIWETGINLDDKSFYEGKISPAPQIRTSQKAARTRINDVARQSSLFRDVHIVNKLGEVLRDHDCVFIVYGGSHAVMQKPAIEKLLGV